MLSDFDLKIQVASIKHLLEFLDELDSDIEQDRLIEQMRMQIHSEIELFLSPSFEDVDPKLQELVEEIVSYYHTQFHTNLPVSLFIKFYLTRSSQAIAFEAIGSC